jgi:hypothetical protein
MRGCPGEQAMDAMQRTGWKDDDGYDAILCLKPVGVSSVHFLKALLNAAGVW